jgi:hypothetical protein
MSFTRSNVYCGQFATSVPAAACSSHNEADELCNSPPFIVDPADQQVLQHDDIVRSFTARGPAAFGICSVQTTMAGSAGPSDCLHGHYILQYNSCIALPHSQQHWCSSCVYVLLQPRAFLLLLISSTASAKRRPAPRHARLFCSLKALIKLAGVHLYAT